MNCPKCHLPVEDDTFFCEHCGAPLESETKTQSINNTDDMEKTTVIPVVKPGVISSHEPERAPVANPVVKKTTPSGNAPKKKATGKSAKKAQALKHKIIFNQF